MATKTKTTKPEMYGPRTLPLMRSTWMTDAQWADAKKDFDAQMRRMGKKVTWAPKPPQRCPDCRTEAGPFRAMSGRCESCAEKAEAIMDAQLDADLLALRARRGGR